MEWRRQMNSKLLISAIAAAAAFAVNVHAAEVVTSGNLNTVDKWYGRAGGLTDADRVVTGLSTSGTKVGISYDADVAARTNMKGGEATTNGQVGISYDADVAARTNMQRGQAPQPKAAGIEGAKQN